MIRKYWLLILFREATLDVLLIQITKLESFVPGWYPSYLSSIPRGSQGHKISSTNVVYITLVSVSWFLWKVFRPCPYLKPKPLVSNIGKYWDSPDWLCTFIGQRPQILDFFSFHVCHLRPEILLSLSSSSRLYQIEGKTFIRIVLEGLLVQWSCGWRTDVLSQWRFRVLDSCRNPITLKWLCLRKMCYSKG